MRMTILFTFAIVAATAATSAAQEAAAPTVESMTTSIAAGFDAMDEDQDGKLPLLDVIKAVRPLGFGAQTEASSEGRGGASRGGQGRGGQARGGQRGGRGMQAGGNRGGRGRAAGGDQAAAPEGRDQRGGNRGGGNRGGGNRGGGAAGGRGGFDPAERFKSFDEDGDGVLKGSEINARLTDSKYAEDGEVTLEEFQAAFEEMRAQMAAGGGHSHGGGGHSHGGGGRGGSSATTSDDAALLVSFDQDRDRVITIAEVKVALQKEVDRQTLEKLKLDKDGDNQISKAEFAAQVEADEETQLDEDGLDRRSRMMFGREDVDQDGAITKQEITQQVLRQLSARAQALAYCLMAADIDADSNDQISAEELKKAAPAELAQLLSVTADQPLAKGSFYQTVRRRLARR